MSVQALDRDNWAVLRVYTSDADVPRLLRLLTASGIAWIESRRRWSRRRTVWCRVPIDELNSWRRRIEEAIPPRMVPYRSPHAWHADAWLSYTTVYQPGAVVRPVFDRTQWPKLWAEEAIDA